VTSQLSRLDSVKQTYQHIHAQRWLPQRDGVGALLDNLLLGAVSGQAVVGAAGGRVAQVLMG
jgi:hypothetical protein